MMNNFRATNKSQVMVEAVPDSQVDKYGITDCDGVILKQGQAAPMVAMVEKPALADAPSNQAVVGRYVLSRGIWDILDSTPVGAGDEVQLTDAIATLMQTETVEAYSMVGKSHDCGSKIGYMLANMEYGLRHAEVGEAMQNFMTKHSVKESELA